MKKDKRCSFRVVIVVNDVAEQSVKDMEYNAQNYIKDDIEMNNLYIEDIIKIEEDNCEHNNTITNECSDCNENELYDLLLRPVLNSIVDTYVGGVNNNLTDLIYDIHEGEVDLTDELVEEMEKDIAILKKTKSKLKKIKEIF